MRARKVKGLDPGGTLFEGARRIVGVRLDELYSFKRAARDPDAVGELHDMRIAAKRLRYVLEITAPAFGPAAIEGARVARKLQDVLGEIHDCDEMLPRVEAHIARLRAEDAKAVRNQAKRGAKDLPAAAALAAPNRDRYRGLETLSAHVRARREVLYARFRQEWKLLQAQGFRAKLEQELDSPAVEAGRGSGAEGTPAARETDGAPAPEQELAAAHRLPRPGGSESATANSAGGEPALR